MISQERAIALEEFYQATITLRNCMKPEILHLAIARLNKAEYELWQMNRLEPNPSPATGQHPAEMGKSC